MTPQKIGLTALTALVLSSMIGSGIFSLPQNMAEVAGAEALIIGWTITGVGIIALGLSFWYLARLRPTLDGGIYAYARDGFGELVGFFSAWGYWLCATIGVTGYLVVAFEALGGFTDTPEQVFFGKGNTPAAFVGDCLGGVLARRARRQGSGGGQSGGDAGQGFPAFAFYRPRAVVFPW